MRTQQIAEVAEYDADHSLILRDNRIDEAEQDNRIDLASYTRAGELLEQWMLRTCATTTKWAHLHGFGVTTVNLLAKGTYNIPSGPSVDLLWRICLALTDNDPRAARRLSYEYLAIIGIVPTAKEVSVIAELAAVEKQLRRLADKVATWK